MIRIGVIGCGHWGPNHVRNFGRLPGVEMAAVADLDIARLAAMRYIQPSLRLETDAKAIIGSGDIDAVVIATPTSTHYPLARAALASGKHVLCEKPLCLHQTEARELDATARSQGLILMVGYTFLFNAGIAALNKLIAQDDLGKVYYLSAVRTNLGPIRSDVNAIYDLATHDIAIFNWLLKGIPRRVQAAGGSFIQKGIEDVVTICLEYPHGVFGTIHVSWLNPRKVRQMSVVGALRMATWDDLEMNTPIAIFDRGANSAPEVRDYGESLRVTMWDGDVRLPKIQLEEPLKVQARYFAEGIAKGHIAAANGDFSIGVMRAVEAAAESLRTGLPIELKNDQVTPRLPAYQPESLP
ncbi:MAG: Gfo/Idh/MocA family oxidoreductase [Candidatus Binataceae bacterium]|jgi:predicted dehydrogenase